jgi:hypothetical protein
VCSQSLSSGKGVYGGTGGSRTDACVCSGSTFTSRQPAGFATKSIHPGHWAAPVPVGYLPAVTVDPQWEVVPSCSSRGGCRRNRVLTSSRAGPHGHVGPHEGRLGDSEPWKPRPESDYRLQPACPRHCSHGPGTRTRRACVRFVGGRRGGQGNAAGGYALSPWNGGRESESSVRVEHPSHASSSPSRPWRRDARAPRRLGRCRGRARRAVGDLRERSRFSRRLVGRPARDFQDSAPARHLNPLRTRTRSARLTRTGLRLGPTLAIASDLNLNSVMSSLGLAGPHSKMA